jgi:hypothetical protein
VQEPETIAVRGKDYLPLLGIVMAAVMGLSLLCGAGIVGINDINNAVSIGTPTAGLVDFVFSNMNTMIVETAQAFSLPEIADTNTSTLTPTITLVAFKTSASFPLVTLPPLGQISRPLSPYTSTYTPLPTPTSTPTKLTATNTSTLTPTATKTLTLTPTATDTPVPTATDTPVPTDTDTPVPNTLIPGP